MCTILLYPETLPAEKRSIVDTQKAVDRLMAFDRQLSEPFTREELKPLFTPDSLSCLSASSIRNGYEVLTDEEKRIVDELGLTPSPQAEIQVDKTRSLGIFDSLLLGLSDTDTVSRTRRHLVDEDTDKQPPLSVEVRRRRMKAALIKTPSLATEEEVKELYRRMKPELGGSSMFVGGLGFDCSGSDHAGQIYVWLDNMNFASAKKGFYYVRYQRSLLWRGTTAYAYPALVVEKSKLRPDQIEYMDRKCRETLASGRKK